MNEKKRIMIWQKTWYGKRVLLNSDASYETEYSDKCVCHITIHCTFKECLEPKLNVLGRSLREIKDQLAQKLKKDNLP